MWFIKNTVYVAYDSIIFLCLQRHIFINIFDEREQVIAERYIIWLEHNCFESSDIDRWVMQPRSEERISEFLKQREIVLKNLRDSMKLILAKIIQESYCWVFLKSPNRINATIRFRKFWGFQKRGSSLSEITVKIIWTVSEFFSPTISI